MFQPSAFKDEGRLENWPLLRPNLDRHVLTFASVLGRPEDLKAGVLS